MSERISVWAYHQEIAKFCDDARLGGESTSTDTPKGQAWWDVAVSFSSAADLASKLKLGIRIPAIECTWKTSWTLPPLTEVCPKVEPGKIARLAIMAHGDRPGYVYVEGAKGRKDGQPIVTRALTADTIKDFGVELQTIGDATTPDGEIIFMSCIAGRGEKGAELLKKLSNLWPGRRVVGFTTIGYKHAGKMKRPHESCQEVGMRATDAVSELEMSDRTYSPENIDRLWPDLEKFPWASATSRFAKIAQNGKIIKAPKHPDDDMTVTPPAAPKKMKAKPMGAKK